MSTQLRKEHGKDEANKKALQVGSLVGLLARKTDFVAALDKSTDTSVHSDQRLCYMGLKAKKPDIVVCKQ